MEVARVLTDSLINGRRKRHVPAHAKNKKLLKNTKTATSEADEEQRGRSMIFSRADMIPSRSPSPDSPFAPASIENSDQNHDYRQSSSADLLPRKAVTKDDSMRLSLDVVQAKDIMIRQSHPTFKPTKQQPLLAVEQGNSSSGSSAPDFGANKVPGQNKNSGGILSKSQHGSSSNKSIPKYDEHRMSAPSINTTTATPIVIEKHPIRLVIERFAHLLHVTYANRLRKAGLTVGQQNDESQPYRSSRQTRGASFIFTSENVAEMQVLGMAMLADVQEFLLAVQKMTSFFYRQSFTLDNHTMQDAIVESITNILFTSEKNSVHYLIRALFSAQHQDVIYDMHRVMEEYTNDFRLEDIKMCNIALEVFKVNSSFRAAATNQKQSIVTATLGTEDELGY